VYTRTGCRLAREWPTEAPQQGGDSWVLLAGFLRNGKVLERFWRQRSTGYRTQRCGPWASPPTY